jgi:hypothetical protein
MKNFQDFFCDVEFSNIGNWFFFLRIVQIRYVRVAVGHVIPSPPKGQNYSVYLSRCQTKCNKYILNIGLHISVAIRFTGMIRTAVECFITRIYAENVSVYSAFCVISSFCHCKDTSWKRKEDRFPVWNVDKIASITYSYVWGSVLYGEREKQHSWTRKAYSLDIRPVCAGVPPVSVGHTAEVLVMKLSHITWKILGIYTEVRHCTEVP